MNALDFLEAQYLEQLASLNRLLANTRAENTSLKAALEDLQKNATEEI